MNSRLLSGRYSMLADVYEQTNIIAESGQVTRSWNRENPIIVKNLTEGVLTDGVQGASVSEIWKEDYEPTEKVKMFISDSLIDPDPINPVVLTRRFRVSNIRDRATGKVLWLNDAGDPLEFNIQGIIPINDPFGKIVEYEVIMKSVISAARS